jgi:hypothetical protein
MIEEIFYLDEGHINITAASVGISGRRWTCINATTIERDSYKSLMKDNRFDILPIIAEDGTTSEFFKTDKPNNYDSISRQIITYKDVLPLDTSVRDIIKGFVTDNRTFYFLTYHSRITGLITLGNLNCRQVQIYIFGLICELEKRLTDFIEDNLSKEQLEKFMNEKTAKNDKLKEIWEHYQELVQSDLENKLIEHLYLIDFFTIIEHFGLNTKLGYSKSKWRELTTINDLRHLVAHPTRSLLDKNNDVNKLWRRIGRIEDLSFRLNQIKQIK